VCALVVILAFFLLILLFQTFFWPLPVNDTGAPRYRTVPLATMALIALNAAIFALWIAPDLYVSQEGSVESAYVNPDYMGKIDTYGYAEPAIRDGTGIGAFATLSAMFMHADLWHLFFNMLYLWTFGRRVEDACGSWRFLAFYLLAGMISQMGAVLLNPSLDTTPSIGASGAIAGVMGAYLFLFPGTQVICLWGLGSILRLPFALARKLRRDDYKFWRWTVSLPAWLLLIGFVVENFVPSLEAIRSDEAISGVNNLAHLAGFLAALTIFLFLRKDLLLRYVHGRSL